MDKQKKYYKIIFLAIFTLFIFIPRVSFAAALSVNPVSGTYKVGDTFTASVDVSSYTQSMNAVSGTLSYPKDYFSIVSVSKNSSILTTWLPPGATGPALNTSSGTIHFEGILIGGYTGGPKNVFSVTFKVKKAGTAKLSFKNGTILANDGKGTDITQGLRVANYKLTTAVTPVVSSVASKSKNTKTNTKNKSTIVPTKIVEQKPVEQPSVIDVTPPVVVSNNPVIPTPAPKTFSDYYNLIFIVALGVLIILVLLLFVRITQLTRIVKQLQNKKSTVGRRKTAGFSTQRIVSRPKSVSTSILKGSTSK